MYQPNHTYNNTIIDLQRRIAIYEDQAAYKQLFVMLFPLLQNFAYSLIKSRQAAEEITSDVFIEIWVRRSRLLEIEDLKMYLYVSIRNACLRKLKQEKNIATLSIEDLTTEFISDYLSPDQLMHADDLEQKIQTAIAELPPKCKLIFKLAKEDKMKYKDIAELLNISIKTIDAQLAIALKKIAGAVQFKSKKAPK